MGIKGTEKRSFYETEGRTNERETRRDDTRGVARDFRFRDAVRGGRDARETSFDKDASVELGY